MKDKIIDIIRKFHLTNEIKTYNEAANQILRLFDVSPSQLLEEYINALMAEFKTRNQALRIHDVVGRSEQLFCDCSQGKGVDIDEDGFPYCIDCQKNVAK